MSQSTRWSLVVIVLAPAVVLPLVVGLYDRSDPELWGFPFYYWFQFMLIPIVSVLTFIAFRISVKALAKDREDIGLRSHADGKDER